MVFVVVCTTYHTPRPTPGVLTFVKLSYSISSGLCRWISAQNARPSLKLKDNGHVTLMRSTGYRRKLTEGAPGFVLDMEGTTIIISIVYQSMES